MYASLTVLDVGTLALTRRLFAVACVVHLTIIQVAYVSASLIGAGGLKAWSGGVTVIVVPLVFLSLLQLQALLSNPFGKFEAVTNFPIAALVAELDNQLSEIDRTLEPSVFESVGCLQRGPPSILAAEAPLLPAQCSGAESGVPSRLEQNGPSPSSQSATRKPAGCGPLHDSDALVACASHAEGSEVFSPEHHPGDQVTAQKTS